MHINNAHGLEASSLGKSSTFSFLFGIRMLLFLLFLLDFVLPLLS